VVDELVDGATFGDVVGEVAGQGANTTPGSFVGAVGAVDGSVMVGRVTSVHEPSSPTGPSCHAAFGRFKTCGGDVVDEVVDGGAFGEVAGQGANTTPCSAVGAVGAVDDSAMVGRVTSVHDPLSPMTRPVPPNWQPARTTQVAASIAAI
jgi:hypothetical protein